MRASEATLGLIAEYYGLMDDGRLEECKRLFAPDATITIAHRPPIAGWDLILKVMTAGMSVEFVKSLTHEVRNAWEEEDGTVIFEVAATYELDGDRTVVVPGVVISQIADGRFLSQRIAADLSPVFGAM